MRLRNFGWIAAAALLAMGVAAGFQTTQTKIGIVDLAKVFGESEFAKSQTETLKGVGLARQSMLEFVDTYRTFTAEQATRFHDLSVKTTPLTAAEKTELEKIKQDVMASDKRLKDLQTKSNPTAAEGSEMQELSRRIQTTTDAAQRWSREANDEVQNLQDKLRRDTLEKVRAAVQEVGKSGGYTVIFVTDVAPYGANDVTPEALKAMNKNK